MVKLGNSLTHAAKLVGVSPSTVTRWRKTDPQFRADTDSQKTDSICVPQPPQYDIAAHNDMGKAKDDEHDLGAEDIFDDSGRLIGRVEPVAAWRYVRTLPDGSEDVGVFGSRIGAETVLRERDTATTA